MTAVADVLDALRGVRDPELDQDLVELGFVTDVVLEGQEAHVRLRLPTFFCAPNFAYLMVADARRAVEAGDGVRRARVLLEDHFTAEEITDAVGREASFTETFPGQAQGELDELRSLFQRKALSARQARLCDTLLAAGRGEAELVRMRLHELPKDPDGVRCRQLRQALGFDVGAEAAAFVLADGRPLTVEEFPRFLRFARLVSGSLEGNAHLCRGLLKTRYDLHDHEEVAA